MDGVNKNPSRSFSKIWQADFKITWKHKELQQTGFIEKKEAGKLTNLQFKIIMKP